MWLCSLVRFGDDLVNYQVCSNICSIAALPPLGQERNHSNYQREKRIELYPGLWKDISQMGEFRRFLSNSLRNLLWSLLLFACLMQYFGQARKFIKCTFWCRQNFNRVPYEVKHAVRDMPHSTANGTRACTIFNECDVRCVVYKNPRTEYRSAGIAECRNFHMYSLYCLINAVNQTTLAGLASLVFSKKRIGIPHCITVRAAALVRDLPFAAGLATGWIRPNADEEL